MDFDPLVRIVGVAASPLIGSFLAVVALRLPQGRGFVGGRSSCDSCGHVLGARDLVPLASHVASGGRCRYCGATIDPIHLVVEAGALQIAVWAAFVTSGWVFLASCLLGWTLLLLSAIDWRTGFLPDVLTLPLVAAGLAVSYAIDPAALLDHGIGAVAGFVGFALIAELYRRLRGRDGLGLGDAKLLAASGAWLSWEALPGVVLIAAALGLGAVLVRSRAGKPIDATSRIAFGPALAGATWLVWLYGPLLPA
jgi:leader peptidase (prepilin peptidase) / N-methyltransferase